jgi:hypothetical protein
MADITKLTTEEMLQDRLDASANIAFLKTILFRGWTKLDDMDIHDMITEDKEIIDLIDAELGRRENAHS